jgi:hypothetical protein
MNCVFCQKLFDLKSNLTRHQKTCKLNPDKPAKTNLSKTQILQELEMMKKVLLHNVENKIVENKVEEKANDIPFKKDKYLIYIERRYSNALDTKNALVELNNLLTLKEYKLIVFKPYVSKYKCALDLLFKTLPLEKRPFVILSNLPSKEIGYVNIDGTFYKFTGRNLYNELFAFITGKGMTGWVEKCKGIQNIFVHKNSELKSQDERFFLSQEDGLLTSFISILGTKFDETDVELKRARDEICRHIFDTCMILRK